MLKIENLNLKYPTSKEYALENINLEASRGEFIVVAGSSGSGKSTLAQVLMTLIPNFIEAKITGEIYYDNQPLNEISRKELSRLLGYVPQYPSDFTTSLLVEEEIVFLLENLGISQEQIESRLATVLSELEIDKLRRRVIPELSSGELQRVFLAAALAYTPPIIILDEPIARIDPKTEVKLVKILKNLAEKGNLVIAFEHRLDYIVQEADRLVVLEKGTIVSDGPPSESISLLKDIDPPELSLLDLEQGDLLLDLEKKIKSSNLTEKLERIKEQETIQNRSKSAKQTIISLEKLNFKYNEKSNWILDDVDIQFHEGESVGLMGINGSGKSTLLKLILGIIKTKKGDVFVNNSKVKRIRVGKKQSVFVPENAKLFLVGPTPLRDLERLTKNKDEAIEIYKKLKLRRLMKRKLYHLSEGERRLYAIVNSFYLQKRIVLLDEPTIALDKKGREILEQLIVQAKGVKKTVILATNDPRIVTSLDRLIVLENGKICLEGTPREVLYKLEKETNLIPNRTVRLLQKLEEDRGISVPKIINPEEFNLLMKEEE